ncbi:MAG: zinc-binding dehydrogenase [Acidimicrobiia bacterium]
MRAVVLTESAVEVAEVADPSPGTGQLLLEVAACGICGTDLHAHSLGIRSGAVLGHEFAGRVVELGAEVDGFKTGGAVCAMPAMACGQCEFCHRGDVVHCRTVTTIGLGAASGGMADLVVTDTATSFVLHPSVDPVIGATVEPMAVALNAMEKAAMGIDEKLLVIGAGPIGLACVLWAKALGVDSVVVSDPVAGRREMAMACGATGVVDPAAENFVSGVRRELGGRPDAVIDAAGARGTVDQSFDAAPYEGRIVIVGLHTAPEQVTVSKGFHKALVLTFSAWYRVKHFRHTVAMMGAGRLDPTPMVTHRSSLESAPDMFAALRTPNDYGKVLLVPGVR